MAVPDEDDLPKGTFVATELGKWWRPQFILLLLFIVLPTVLFGGCLVINHSNSQHGPSAPRIVHSTEDKGQDQLKQAFNGPGGAADRAVSTFDNVTTHYAIRIYGHVVPKGTSDGATAVASDLDLKADRAILTNGTIGKGLMVSVTDKAAATYALGVAMDAASDWSKSRQSLGLNCAFELIVTGPAPLQNHPNGALARNDLTLSALNDINGKLLMPIAKLGSDVEAQSALVDAFKIANR